MNDELVARARDADRNSVQRMNGSRIFGELADRIEALTAEVRRLDYSTIHTCWDECPRLPCAQRREIEALTAQLATLRAEIERLTEREAPYATKADSDGDDGA